MSSPKMLISSTKCEAAVFFSVLLKQSTKLISVSMSSMKAVLRWDLRSLEALLDLIVSAEGIVSPFSISP